MHCLHMLLQNTLLSCCIWTVTAFKLTVSNAVSRHLVIYQGFLLRGGKTAFPAEVSLYLFMHRLGVLLQTSLIGGCVRTAPTFELFWVDILPRLLVNVLK